MSERGVSELMVAICNWALTHGGEGAHARPGVWEGITEATGKMSPLRVKLNPHTETVDDVPQFSAQITSDVFVAVCIVNPYGGSVIGFDEAALIEHFKAQPS